MSQKRDKNTFTVTDPTLIVQALVGFKHVRVSYYQRDGPVVSLAIEQLSQVVVSLLVDRTGFPLEIHCFPGNKAEAQRVIPIAKAFQDRNQVADVVVVADARMLSAGNLEVRQEAGLRFIVCSRMTEAPKDLASYFECNTTVGSDDGAAVDTVTTGRGRAALKNPGTLVEPTWDSADPAYKNTWRPVWQYRHKRVPMTRAISREAADKYPRGPDPYLLLAAGEELG